MLQDQGIIYDVLQQGQTHVLVASAIIFYKNKFLLLKTMKLYY